MYLNNEKLLDSFLDNQQTLELKLPTKNASTEGKHSWAVEVYDLAGNVFKQTYAGEIDRTKPTLTLNNPPSLASKAFNLSFNATDKNLDSVKLFDGTREIDVTGKKSVQLKPANYEGIKDISLTARDKAGNTVKDSFKLTWRANFTKDIEFWIDYSNKLTLYIYDNDGSDMLLSGGFLKNLSSVSAKVFSCGKFITSSHVALTKSKVGENTAWIAPFKVGKCSNDYMDLELKDTNGIIRVAKVALDDVVIDQGVY